MDSAAITYNTTHIYMHDIDNTKLAKANWTNTECKWFKEYAQIKYGEVSQKKYCQLKQVK